MNQTNTLSCPSCNSPIYYDVYELLRGQKFTCPNCNLVISLANESHDIVEKAMDKYEKLKFQAGKN